MISVCIHLFSSVLPQPVPLSDREVISRLRNCIVALATQKLMLFDTSILYCYEASLPHQVQKLVPYTLFHTLGGGGLERLHQLLLKLISYVVGLLFIFPKDFVVSDNTNFPLTHDINCLGHFQK